MRTTVYVDGFNLYYSLLKYSPYKWLNLEALFKNKIIHQHCSCDVITIKYYTSPIKTNFATHGEQALKAQQDYCRALNSLSNVNVVYGKLVAKKDTPLQYLQPPDKNKRYTTWAIEEKHTDVNIALDMYRDAVSNKVDQIVLCSNDTDLETALRYLKLDYPNIIRGVVIPQLYKSHNRQPAKSLIDSASWIRRGISNEELKESQFKARVATFKLPADKPDYW